MGQFVLQKIKLEKKIEQLLQLQTIKTEPTYTHSKIGGNSTDINKSNASQ